MLLFITHKAILRGFPEYQSIIIQNSNIFSRNCHVMKLVQRSTSLAYSELPFMVIAQKIWHSLYNITFIV